MEIFLNTSTLINSISINTDILETNLINIAILVVVLIQFVGGAFTTALADRKQKILENVNDAEKRLSEAKERLSEANIQLAQTKVAIDKIVQELQLTKINLIKNGANQVYQEMLTVIKEAELNIARKEQNLLTILKQEIMTLAIHRVVAKLKKDLSVAQHLRIINKCITRLGVFVSE